jgi:hypothetical protein
MRELYRTDFYPAQTGALVIHCSDARYRPCFHRFVEERAKPGAWQLLALPGGPQTLALGASEAACRAGWQWLEFLIEKGKPPRVLLVAHSDCLWYLEGPCAESPSTCLERQIEDLRAVGRELRRRYPELHVELYYARQDNNQVVFAEV